MEQFFQLKQHGTTVRTEIMAGFTTFMAMAYILMVNAGMFAELEGQVTYNAVYIATAISAVIGTVLIGLLSNLPLAQASGMGLNAYFVYTVCFGIGLSYANALVLVLADGASNPAWVAADLLSQAEHDRMASAVLVTDSRALAEQVARELEVQLSRLERADIARESIERNGKIIVARSLEEGIQVANRIAPEHLELCVDQPFDYLSQIRNAGSIFLGRYDPEPLGDYFAGPNHTLPTMGTARFYSPLSVDDFIKKSQFSYYTREALERDYRKVGLFARREGLTAHARAVEIRFEGEEGAQ